MTQEQLKELGDYAIMKLDRKTEQQLQKFISDNTPEKTDKQRLSVAYAYERMTKIRRVSAMGVHSELTQGELFE